MIFGNSCLVRCYSKGKNSGCPFCDLLCRAHRRNPLSPKGPLPVLQPFCDYSTKSTKALSWSDNISYTQCINSQSSLGLLELSIGYCIAWTFLTLAATKKYFLDSQKPKMCIVIQNPNKLAQFDFSKLNLISNPLFSNYCHNMCLTLCDKPITVMWNWIWQGQSCRTQLREEEVKFTCMIKQQKGQVALSHPSGFVSHTIWLILYIEWLISKKEWEEIVWDAAEWSSGCQPSLLHWKSCVRTHYVGSPRNSTACQSHVT